MTCSAAVAAADSAGPSGTVAAVFAAARSQPNVPYCWGGGDRNGLTRGQCAPGAPGFGCTGGVQFAFWQGARFTFTAGTNGGPPGSIHHVAIYSGGGRMIEAPHTGALVREVPVRLGGDLLARPIRWETPRDRLADRRRPGRLRGRGGCALLDRFRRGSEHRRARRSPRR